MFTASAEFYDLIYSTIKDYASEAAQIAAIVRSANPGARSVLDAACGTGEHARQLAALGFEVDGFDLDPNFVRIAQRKHPSGRFFVADMTAFAAPSRYDAVLCLFSSIGYLRTIDRVRQALACFRDHLSPGGVLVVEPWMPPGVLDPSRTATHAGAAGDVRVSRESRIEVDGPISRLLFTYEISDASGTRHASEVHTLGLFSRAEMQQAFEDAGLTAGYDAGGPSGRGLYVATAAG